MGTIDEKNNVKINKSKINTINRKKIKLKSERIRARERQIKVIKNSLLIMTVFLIVTYLVLKLFYEDGNFTICLDDNLAQKSGLVMYERLAEKDDKRLLKATKADFIDNISEKWLPADINKTGEGSHNGKNYFAYSFYVENKGYDVINYWYQIIIDDVIRNADKAIRVLLYRNDERIVYAKASERTGEAEPGTEKFQSATEVVVKQRENFNPGDIDKFTIVVFVEGNDPECLDNIIGGEVKMHMDITEEHIEK